MNTDILIVGAGPTGLTLAAELALRGADFRLIDAGRGLTDLSKALGVQARTLELLDIMDSAQELLRRGRFAHVLRAYDGAREILEISFAHLDTRFKYILIVPQSETERVLLETLERRGGKVERGVELTGFTQDPAGVTATLKHESGEEEAVRAQYIVGCDGAHSAVRHRLNLPFEGEEYPEGFLLADLHIVWERPRDEAYLYLHNGNLLGYFPLPSGSYRIIGDLPPDQAPTDRAPTLEECQRLINERMPFPVLLRDLKWSSFYRIHRRIVPRMQEGRVFLAGDAAHIHSPAAAQGMNTGIQDAFNLGWKLALAARGKGTEALLESYNAERYPIERGVLEMTDSLLKMMSLHNPAGRAIRDTLLPLAGHSALAHLMEERVSELAVSYGHTLLERTISLGEGAAPSHGGGRAPDATLTCPNGKTTRLYELLRTGKFLALAFPPNNGGGDADASDLAGAMTAALQPISEHVDRYLVEESTEPAASVVGEYDILIDFDSVLRDKLHIRHGRICLIRPDGYIAGQTTREHLAADFAGWIHRVFGIGE